MQANERAREAIEAKRDETEDEEIEETDGEEAEEPDDENPEKKPSTVPSIAYGIPDPTLSSLIGDEEGDFDENESSIYKVAVDDMFHPPPAKSSFSKPHRYHRRKLRTS
ncbi:hypothetical protein K469DRAFT_770003 [Zopfia rhizophila CBS 207.26]|uniref:Uncharacterized protein n=1 Tax=Zopfia rhizophila CBS 207.26 TaxID=1314779 RepID=A0A6A6E7R5_9PEZI|nr:hypothetical protein K469DRAFT_770003 [Zopfia rhizophila CBS 207.26]